MSVAELTYNLSAMGYTGKEVMPPNPSPSLTIGKDAHHGVIRSGELSLPLIRCSTQENEPEHSLHSRANWGMEVQVNQP